MKDHTFGLPLFPLKNLKLSDSAFHRSFMFIFCTENASGRMARNRRAYGVGFHSKLLNITPHQKHWHSQCTPSRVSDWRYVLRHSI